MDKKTIVLGTFPSASQKLGKYYSPLTVKVRLEIVRPTSPDDKPRLSITGEVGYPGARDCESCGQIQDEVRRLLDTPRSILLYPREKIARLLDVWDRWHLNDMRPGCEHQRADKAAWDPSAKIQLTLYRLRRDVLVKRHNVERDATARLERGETVAYTPAELAMSGLPWEVVRGEGLTPGPEYEVAKRETKTAGWVRPDEHPAGILSKPCPTCGYRYGSAWLYEPLPADVVAFLEDF